MLGFGRGKRLLWVGVVGVVVVGMGSSSREPNRLIHEKSPYLQQHAENPVDWYPWGQEAFDKARLADKPIFLSIGYSTCHWCHVMEHESFEDSEIAAMMNRWFVNIKVDREEHPDVDQVYMNAVQAMTGQGGWPLTAILTPDLKPFFGGTYFPKEQRFDRPGMKELLPRLAELWQTKRNDLVASAEQLTTLVQQHLAQTAPGKVRLETLHHAFQQAAAAFDPAFGGFGEAPKFPRSHELSFLLRYWARTGSAEALEMATTTLEHLASGGIHDHLGGGFHRYATDAQWLVPHFEKMLYDQALLARAFLEAYRATRQEAYADAARGIFEYVLRDLTDPEGGFYSAEDADSEGEEGKFYVWRPEEVTEVVGPDAGALVNEVYGVTPEGNFTQGTSILHLEQPLDAFARQKGDDPRELIRLLSVNRNKLLEARSRRVRPNRDDKILTSWNGLMIASLAYGAATFDEPRYLESAQRAATFVLKTLRRDGVLLRRYRAGEARYPGTLDDYAFLCWGLLELYEAGFEPHWLSDAKTIAAQMVERFWDSAQGGFWLRDRSEEPPLIASSKEVYDGATPSGNAVAALVLLKLGRLTADEQLESYGGRLLEAFADQVAQTPFQYPQMLTAWDVGLGPTQEIVIAGGRGHPMTRRMLGVLRARFLPRTVVLLHPPEGPERGAIEALAPYLVTQTMLNGRPTAYVCERYVCKLPVTDEESLRRLLPEIPSAPRE